MVSSIFFLLNQGLPLREPEGLLRPPRPGGRSQREEQGGRDAAAPSVPVRQDGHDQVKETNTWF